MLLLITAALSERKRIIIEELWPKQSMSLVKIKKKKKQNTRNIF